MALNVTVDFPELPKGIDMDLGGLLVKNGESTEIDEEQELRFVSRNRKAFKEWAEGGGHVKVTGSPKYGPAAVDKMFAVAEPEEAKKEEEEGGES